MLPYKPQIVGIDVSKEWLDAAHCGRVERLENSASAIRSLARRLKAVGVTTVGLEPTGGYERLAVAIFRAEGFIVLQVDSWRCRQYAKGKGIRRKSDPLDARMIAAFLAENEARPFPEPSRVQAELTAWVREIARAEDDIRRLENRLGHCEIKAIRRLQEAEITAIERSVAKAEQAIRSLIAADEQLALKAALLESVPGIGPKTVRVLLAEFTEIGTLGNRQAAGPCGLVPYQQESGKTRRRGHIEGGRSALRRAAYLAAFAAIRHNPWATALYKDLRARGKPAKVAIIAIARRLITILNAMLRDRTPWNLQKA
jgi:transposase